MSATDPAATLQLAIEHHRAGRLNEAEALYRLILSANPNHAEALFQLGVLAQQTGHDPIDLYRRALSLNPRMPAGWNNLSLALRISGRTDEAVEAARRAVGLKPDYAAAYENLTAALLVQGKIDEALQRIRHSLKLDSASAYAWFYLGNALYMSGSNEEAAQAYRQTLTLNPAFADAMTNLASALHACGRIDEALEADRQAIALSDDRPRAHSRMLFTLNFFAGYDARRIYEAHREWGRRYADALAASAAPHVNDRSPDRRLRIGYVSPDFLGHVVSRFFEPLLLAHDRERFEVFCYCNSPAHDVVTQRLRGLSHAWREIDRVNDAAAAQLVRQDGIDILIDLAGHTNYNRMMLFAHRPAPVQMSYLGYPNTAGTTAIDVRITDAIADPPGDADALQTERLARLARTAWCYRPPDESGEPAPPASNSSAGLTFGSFNNLAKVNDVVLDLWARVIRATPQSRLLLKAMDLRDSTSRTRLHDALLARGLDEERIEIVSATPTLAQHYATYAKVDVALDTMPYNGTTTTCDALWMGVPVVTLRGDRHCARVSASLLNAVGLDELIADSADDYVTIATHLAQDAARRAELRAKLRQRVRQSPLMDAAGLARAIEQVYRDAWASWVAAH